MSTGIATGSACHSEGFGIYVSSFETGGENSFVRAYGPPRPDPETCPPPEVPPSIDAQYATSVDTTEAALGGQIDPHFWSGGGVLGTTDYLVQYGTAPCSEGGCASQPAPPGAVLPAEAVEEDIATPGIFVKGLKPGTTYHYRFVAQSLGGGPVYGAGGTEEEAGEESTFTTYPEPEAPNTDRPNQALRSGASAALPDCRAYEMVSPVDKQGGDVLVTGGVARLEQSAVSGNGFTYSSYRAFGSPKAGPFTSQYIARRDPSAGWQSESVSAPQEGQNLLPNEFLQLQDLDKAFSPDLATAWNLSFTEPVLGEGGTEASPTSTGARARRGPTGPARRPNGSSEKPTAPSCRGPRATSPRRSSGSRTS